MHEYEGIKGLEQLQKEVPEVEQIIADDAEISLQLVVDGTNFNQNLTNVSSKGRCRPFQENRLG